MSATDAEQSKQLFLEHHDRLHRFARQLVGTSADADDLVQQTFLKAHDYLRNGNTIRAPVSFLFVTVRNLVNDGYRRKKIQLADSTVDVDDIAPDGEGMSVERQVMSEREFEQLCTVVAELPERMRDAFVLKKVYGYSCREIAEQMGTSAETVRKQAAGAFKRLQVQQKSLEKPKRVNGHVNGQVNGQANGQVNGSDRGFKTASARNHE